VLDKYWSGWRSQLAPRLRRLCGTGPNDWRGDEVRDEAKENSACLHRPADNCDAG